MSDMTSCLDENRFINIFKSVYNVVCNNGEWDGVSKDMK